MTDIMAVAAVAGYAILGIALLGTLVVIGCIGLATAIRVTKPQSQRKTAQQALLNARRGGAITEPSTGFPWRSLWWVGFVIFTLLLVVWFVWWFTSPGLPKTPGRPTYQLARVPVAVLDWLPLWIAPFALLWGVLHVVRKASWALKWAEPTRNVVGMLMLAVGVYGGWRHYEGDPLSRGSAGVSRGDVAATVGVPLASQEPQKLWRGGVPPNSESTDFLPVMGRLWPKIVSASGPYKIRCVYASGQDMLVEGDNCPREGLIQKKPVNPTNSTLYFTYGWEL